MTKKRVCQVEKNTWQKGALSTGTDQVAEEAAVALVYNGISHVVMMATPADLSDMALGFSLSEGILQNPSQLLNTHIKQTDKGIELCMEITSEPFIALKSRRRNLTGRTGCGLCGAEALDQVIRAPALVGSGSVSHRALQHAIADLQQYQPLQAQTGAVHAAAWCDRDGQIRLLREDVGRHNALDKLIGAYVRAGVNPDGFIVVTSRASYEMVIKTAWADVGLLAAVSAPTSLAIELAENCGLTLVGFARPERHVVYTHPERLTE